MIRWKWEWSGPLVSGLSQQVAIAADLIEPRAASVVNLRTRAAPGQPKPAFLATSVKGVFRSVGAWLIERLARDRWRLDHYLTCDYGQSLPEKWSRARPAAQAALCPACRIFGGAGCLSTAEGDAPRLRLKSPLAFTFAGGSDAYHGEVAQGGPYRFAWQQVANKKGGLAIERLQPPPDGVELVARLETGSAAHQALLFLAGDLISSGFFRFGRFTSRGHGLVRLTPQAHCLAGLHDLLAGDPLAWTDLPDGGTGLEAARLVLAAEPLELVGRFLEQYQAERK